MAGLLDWVTEKAKQQYQQGLLNQVINDPASIGRELGQLFDPAYMSQVKPMTQDQAISTALDINPVLTFIGKGSKLWNSDLAKKAVELEKKGVSPENIWRQTGTLRGIDGKLRQEISDVGASVTDNVYEGIVKNKRFEGKMGKALSHPDLYKSYPDISEIGTGMYAWRTPEGSYDEISRTITAGGPGTTSQKSALLHEIQHDIQRKEGFATGGSPENMKDVALEMLRRDVASGEIPSTNQAIEMLPMAQQNAYKRLAGEAEARLTQSRMKLTPEERLQYFPYNEGQYGLDVPLNQLIIRGLLK